MLRCLGWAVVPAAVVLAYPVWFQFFGANHVVNSGAIHGTDIYVTDPANFVVPTVAQLFSPQTATGISSHFSGNASEWDAYLGIPLILLLIVAAARFWRVPVIRTAVIAAAVVAVLSLGPHINVQGTPCSPYPCRGGSRRICPCSMTSCRTASWCTSTWRRRSSSRSASARSG